VLVSLGVAVFVRADLVPGIAPFLAPYPAVAVLAAGGPLQQQAEEDPADAVR